MLNYESTTMYNDNISSNSQAGQRNMGMHFHEQLSCFFLFFFKHNFNSIQTVYGCLSVYRHNVSPHFNNCCLSQLPTVLADFKLPFSRTYVMVPVALNMVPVILHTLLMVHVQFYLLTVVPVCSPSQPRYKLTKRRDELHTSDNI